MSENMAVAVEEPPLRSAPSVPPPTPYVFQPLPPARTPVFVWGLAIAGALLFLIICGTPFLVRSILNSPEGRWHELKVTGNDYLVKKDFKTAERYYRASLAEADKMGPRDWHAAMSLHNLGVSQERMGRYSDAESSYSQALALKENDAGPESDSLGVTLSGLAYVCLHEKKYVRAEELYCRVIAMQEAANAVPAPHYGLDLWNLAATFWSEYKFESAAVTYKRALARLQIEGQPDDKIQEVQGYLAEALMDTGRFSEAEPICRSRIKAQQSARTAKDKKTFADSLAQLSGSYCERGNWKAALPLKQRALAIYHSLAEKNVDAVIAGSMDVGDAYAALGQYSKAFTSYRNAKSLLKKGSDAAWWEANYFGGVGGTLACMHRLPEADASLRRALRAFHHIPNAAANGESSTWNSLGVVCYEEGKWNEAEALFNQSAAHLSEYVGPDHPFVAVVAHNQAAIWQALHQADKSRLAHRRAVAVWKTYLCNNPAAKPSIVAGLVIGQPTSLP